MYKEKKVRLDKDEKHLLRRGFKREKEKEEEKKKKGSLSAEQSNANNAGTKEEKKKKQVRSSSGYLCIRTYEEQKRKQDVNDSVLPRSATLGGLNFLF